MDPKIIEALGLDADADEGKVTAEIARLRADNGELRAALKDRDVIAAERDALAQKLKAKEADELKGEADRTIAALAADGRLKPGGDREKLLRRFFDAGDKETAEALAATYREGERIVPVGPRQSDPAAEAATPHTGLSVPRKGDGTVDWQALFAQLPDHVKAFAGPYAKDPEKFIRANKNLLEGLGADFDND